MAIHRLDGGHCFWGFINRTLNTTCHPILNQHQFYFGHKQKHGYQYQAIITLDSMVSSLIGAFIGWRRDWKMVELLGLDGKLKAMNIGRRPAQALYLYGDPAYSTVYSIIEPYKNYLGRPRTPAHNQFNKIISKLRIEVEHGFAIHQNL